MSYIQYVKIKDVFPFQDCSGWQLLHWECQESTTEMWSVATANYQSDITSGRHNY